MFVGKEVIPTAAKVKGGNKFYKNKFVFVLIRLLNIGFILFVLSPISAQVNLVPNPGFDEFDNCPNSFSQIEGYVKDWYTVKPTPDYFNECSAMMGVPLNTLGYQTSRSGSGYIGAQIYSANNHISVPMEYFQVKLKSKLIEGKKYCVSFFVNPSGASGYYIDCFGAYFSQTIPIYPGNNIDGSHVPQVSNLSGNVIADTIVWSKIAGDFLAEGGEEYLTLGCFTALVGIDTIKNLIPSPALTLNSGSYYFFEDVSVFYCDESTLEDVIIPNVFTPNNDGINDFLDLSFQGDSITENLNMVIYNRWGGEVYKTRNALVEPWGGNSVLGNIVSTGVYYYVLYDEKNTKTGFVHVSY